MLRYSLEESRRSIMDLRSQALESLDLPDALASLARQMTIGTRIDARVHVTGTRRRLGAAEEHHLLRIGLEALTNAVKHAQPARIDIALDFGADGTTSLVVQDDGCGLAGMPAERPGEHFGLQGIRERVDKLGGTLQIAGEPGRGTRLSVTIRSSRRHAVAAAEPPAPDVRTGAGAEKAERLAL
jgi:signal transduction histidine kinase